MPRPPGIFVSLTTIVPFGSRDLDPFALFTLSHPAQRLRFAWRAFDSPVTHVGFGSEAGAGGTGGSRGGDGPTGGIGGFVRRVNAPCLDAAGRGTSLHPRWFGGIAFDPWSEPAPPWSGYLGSEFHAPAVGFAVGRTSTRITITAHARTNDEAEMRRRLASLAEGVVRCASGGGLDGRDAPHQRDSHEGDPRGSQAMAVRRSDGTRSHRLGVADGIGAPDPILAERLKRAVAAIDDGTVRKVVVAASRTVTVDVADDDVPALARAVAAGAPGCTLFVVSASESNAVWLGATPERLVRVRGHRLWTMALAGTAPRGRDASEDRALGAALLASDKDRREHAAVVDAIRTTLAADPDLDVVAAPAPRLRRLATLQHLETPITARSRTRLDVLDIARRLHPTPALAGSPREAALDLIAELEPDGRGWYGGAVGWIDGTGDGDLAVGIRGILLHDRQATAYAGAGLVAGSNVAAEAREIELKLAAALAPLSAFRR